MDGVALARKAEAMYKTFRNVSCGVTIDYTANGKGSAIYNEFFWSPTKFRIDYLVFASTPTTEHLVSDGARRFMRLGPEVGKKYEHYKPSDPAFNAASNAQLVERWPRECSKLIFTQFANGNATISRYVSALKSGVGGYSFKVQQRDQLFQGKAYRDHRILAERPARRNRPASRVEIVFGAPGMPVTINTSYGPKFSLRWRGQWYNNVKMPTDDPFKAG